MGLFVCSKCNCVENTALGWYWSRNSIRLVLPPEMKDFEIGKALCSECLPATARFTDGGKPREATGKWHNKFPKQHIDDFMKQPDCPYKRHGDSLTYIGN